ncbi:MAG: biotin/lipoyl-containing protein [Candidatus Woesearchaeota archaeon]|jgi:biotin carboxyl carrier protein|nr:biotin/lipoyl-containing protein [Candidatus Woesearchaeota archaeon]|tara:strand:- start:158 stop:544 length:387 start_codon:yes stop_codon:yes gene_type:complete
MEDVIVKIDGKEHKVKIEDADNGKIKVHFDGDVYEVETKAGVQNIEEEIGKNEEKKGGDNSVVAPLPGTITAVNVKCGQKVKSGEVLLKMVAMKMENEILSSKEGVVKEIKVKKGDNVNKDDILVVID